MADTQGRPDVASDGVAEQERLAALYRYGLIEREVDPALTALVELATTICGVPKGAVNLIDADRQWQITAVGTEAAHAPRAASYCDVTIAEDRPVVVPDARTDPRFAERGFTTGEYGELRTYVGAKLVTDEGHALGTLCVFDEQVHHISPDQVASLALLADQAMALLESRYQATQLAEAEQRFRLAFLNAPIGMALVDLTGRYLQVNPALSDLVGYDEPDLLAMNADQLTHPDDLEQEQLRRARIAAGEVSSFRVEKRYRHREGHDVWVEVWVSVVRDVDDAPRYLITQVEDISARRQVELGLIHQAMHDPLTGLPNRLLLTDRLEHAAAVQRRGGCLAVLSLDLDGFKLINDTHGHAVGDVVLAAVAERLPASLRPEDTVARLGGDEFVVVSHAVHADVEEIRDLAQRLVVAVGVPIIVGDRTLEVGVTVGGVVVTTSAIPDELPLLLERSDQALYRAKRAGRGSVEVVRWDPTAAT